MYKRGVNALFKGRLFEDEFHQAQKAYLKSSIKSTTKRSNT